MISESLTILILISLIFLSGTYLGQLIFKIRLAKLERENLMLGHKRMMELKELLGSKPLSSGKSRSRSSSHSRIEVDKAVRDEIDDILGEIEGK
jgi:hypothetical protein